MRDSFSSEIARTTGASAETPWSDLIPKLARLPWLAYKHRRLIHHSYLSAAHKLRLAKTNIVVTGRSSVGKSILLDRLKLADKDWDWKPPKRSLSVESHVIRLGAWARLVSTIPGDTIQERDLGMHEAFSSHERLEGVIYVTDWGYTRERDPIVRKTYIEQDGITTVSKLRTLNLKNEITDFRKTCERIRESHARCERPTWLLIAVNKADLFQKHLDTAQNYYHPSMKNEFTEPLHEMKRAVGGDFRVEVAPVCAWEEDFEWNGKVVTSAIGGADSTRALLRNILTLIGDLADGEGNW